MTDGFVVVCDEDGILFGVGKTKVDALADAQSWIDEAVREQVRAEIHHLQTSPSNSVIIDLTWSVHPATQPLIASVGKRGGHDDWHKRPDGTLDLGRNIKGAK